MEGLEWVNKLGRTPLDIARLEGHDSLAAVLGGMRNRRRNDLHVSLASAKPDEAEQIALLECRPVRTLRTVAPPRPTELLRARATPAGPRPRLAGARGAARLRGQPAAARIGARRRERARGRRVRHRAPRRAGHAERRRVLAAPARARARCAPPPCGTTRHPEPPCARGPVATERTPSPAQGTQSSRAASPRTRANRCRHVSTLCSRSPPSMCPRAPRRHRRAPRTPSVTPPPSSREARRHVPASCMPGPAAAAAAAASSPAEPV